MNDANKLPDNLKGKWIWDPQTDDHDCERLLFRSDFVLKEMPSDAEMWFATHAFFQVSINGRHCTAGTIPHPGPERNAYAMRLDITHLLDVGVNRISIIANVEKTNLSGIKNTVSGIWMQININNKPIEWTDGSWAVKTANAYLDTGLRTAPCDVFTECVDMGMLRNDWMSTDVDKLILSGRNIEGGWHAPSLIRDAGTEYCLVEPFEQPPRTAERIRNPRFVCTGTVLPNCQATWVAFGESIKDIVTPGTYIAETYVLNVDAVVKEALLVCDAPYILYVNGQPVKRQAVPPLVYRGASTSLRAQCLQPQDYVSPYLDMPLEIGWNHIMIVVECLNPQTGFALQWLTVPDGKLALFQQEDAQSEAGWSVAGPLNVPMALIYPTFPRDCLTKYPADASITKIFDISSYYFSCNFEGDDVVPTDYPINLDKGKYLIVDFGQIRYAYPSLRLRGSAGDIVDVVCGEHLRDKELLAYQPGERRNVSTVVLKRGVNEWQSMVPKGVRYVMVIVRNSNVDVSIDAIELWQESLDVRDAGSFACSSPVLENVWKISERTMSTTLQRIYMDSPTGDQAQALPDAMIQSWAAYYTFGLYDMAGYALESFARSQFETGELNAASPSALFQALPDYSLCWPVWLQRHFLHTGDTDFLQKMLPCLQKLMYYYNEIAIGEDGPLGDLQDYMGVFAFIDYGSLERRGITSALNGLYCKALLSASWLAEEAGLSELAAIYRKRAGIVSHKVKALLWNEEKQLFADSYIDGEQTESCSWQSNILAIYGGIATQDQYDVIWNQIFTDEAPLEKMVEPETNNPYFKYYVLEVAFALGKAQWALSLIHYYWGGMANAGARTWWETFDPRVDVDDQVRIFKRCCGYGVSPNAFLINELVGIRPAEPGMRMVYFNPTPGDVNWARATIPTPSGRISVYWKLEDDGTFNVNISSTYILEVIPVLDADMASQAIFNVSDNVSILAPDEEEE